MLIAQSRAASVCVNTEPRLSAPTSRSCSSVRMRNISTSGTRAPLRGVVGGVRTGSVGDGGAVSRPYTHCVLIRRNVPTLRR